MKPRRTATITLSVCAALAMPLNTSAHHAMANATPGNLWQGLISGLAHPVIGLDHLLFVLAVGAACYYFGQRAGTIVTFLAGAIAGTALHLHRATLPYPDAWIALSLLVLGLLFVLNSRVLKSRFALAIFALAGILHGYAYGESIVGAEATPLAAYLAGFTLVQLAIAFCGYAIARYIDRSRPSAATVKAVGGGVTLAGAAFLFLALGGP